MNGGFSIKKREKMLKTFITALFAGLSVFVYEMWIKGFLAAHNFFPSGMSRAFWDALFTAIICVIILLLLKKTKIIN